MSPNKLAFVFPGQGSQEVGMGRSWAEAFPEAGKAFEEADQALGFDLTRLCWEGPAGELRLTANTQPALLTTSIAIHRVLGAQGLKPAAMAGHSLGEYSALVAAGALEFPRALELVRCRGECMQEAVPVGQGAMAAILGLTPEIVADVAAAAREGEICSVANYNSPQQTVLAGHTSAVQRALELAQRRGAKRAVLLEVSAPFHSPLMEPARRALAPHLEEARFNDPMVPVISNVDATPVWRAEEVRQALIRQVSAPVRWADSVRHLSEEMGVETFVEVGPGRVLSSLIRRIVPGVRTFAMSEPAALEELLTARGMVTS